jgi:hypothetical protein
MRRIAIPVAFCLLLLSCAQPPAKEVEMASARVEAARAQDAAVFAPELFAEAEDALAEARLALGEPSRYGAALRAAATASLRADEAFAKARGERIVVERRLDQLLYELESLIEMAEGSAGTEELAEARARYENVLALARAGNVLAAFHEGSALKPELLAIETSLRR